MFDLAVQHWNVLVSGYSMNAWKPREDEHGIIMVKMFSLL